MDKKRLRTTRWKWHAVIFFLGTAAMSYGASRAVDGNKSCPLLFSRTQPNKAAQNSWLRRVPSLFLSDNQEREQHGAAAA